jgi:hypothetical protein
MASTSGCSARKICTHRQMPLARAASRATRVWKVGGSFKAALRPRLRQSGGGFWLRSWSPSSSSSRASRQRKGAAGHLWPGSAALASWARRRPRSRACSLRRRPARRRVHQVPRRAGDGREARAREPAGAALHRLHAGAESWSKKKQAAALSGDLAMAAHESPRTAKLYDRSYDRITRRSQRPAPTGWHPVGQKPQTRLRSEG